MTIFRHIIWKIIKKNLFTWSVGTYRNVSHDYCMTEACLTGCNLSIQYLNTTKIKLKQISGQFEDEYCKIPKVLTELKFKNNFGEISYNFFNKMASDKKKHRGIM